MDKRLIERGTRQAWFHRFPRGLPVLIVLLVAAVTLVGVIAIERVESRRHNAELDRTATEIAAALDRRAAENISYLRATAALYATRKSLPPDEFRRFATSIATELNESGALGIGWIPRIDPQRVAAAAVSGDAVIGGLRVWPLPEAGSGEPAYAVSQIEPMNAINARAIGYNMYFERTRHKAMDAAARTGQPVASGKLVLVQDMGQRNEPGFLIFMPVFDVVDGQRVVRGFVYSPFRAREFMNAASDIFERQAVSVVLYDQSRKYDTFLASRVLPGRMSGTISKPIAMAGRRWVLEVSVLRQQALSLPSQLTLLFGSLIALMLMTLSWLITNRAAEDRQVIEWQTSQAEIRNSLTRELNHRVKNTLANVLSIIALTRRRSSTLDEFADSLDGRVRALSATHDLLTASNWGATAIADIIRSELAPYMSAGDSHVSLTGPAICLAPGDALSLGLAIHELATNAAKYGALSVPDGRVTISWDQASPESAAEVRWRESGGPPVTAPDKRGFGRDLLEKIVAHELRAPVDLRFEPGGVECKLQVPVRGVTVFNMRAGTAPAAANTAA